LGLGLELEVRIWQLRSLWVILMVRAEVKLIIDIFK